MSRGKDLPIMIGSGLHKGLIAMRNNKWPGFELWIVWLKKDFGRGESFDLADVDKVDHVLHFCDRESVEETIKTLENILKMWGGEKRGGKTEKARRERSGDSEGAAQAGSK